jgi:hypothetical protein
MVASSAEHLLPADGADLVRETAIGKRAERRKERRRARGDERAPGFNSSGKAANDMAGAALNYEHTSYALKGKHFSLIQYLHRRNGGGKLQVRRPLGVFEATAGRAISRTFRVSARTENRRIAVTHFLARLGLIAGICISNVAATAAAEQETSARPLPSAAQREILAALDQPTEFDFQKRPLSDAIDYFSQKHAIEILLDSKALGEAMVDTDTPITQKLKNITLRSALRLLLMQFDSTFFVGDGYLMITSKTEAAKKLSCKIYPVHDLVTLDSGFRPARLKGDQRHDSSVLREVVPSSFGRFPGSRGEAGDFESLINAITSTVMPETWDETGGPGTITDNRNSQAIAVSQTDEVHEEIVALLAALRRVRDVQMAVAQPVDSPVDSPVGLTLPSDVPEKNPRTVRAYRLMRGTTHPGKSGWRPPVRLGGDSTPPRNAQASGRKQEAPGSSGESGAGKEATPAQETGPAKEAASAASATDKGVTDKGVTDKGAPTKRADPKLEELAEKIATLVPEMIDPESWEPAGEGMIRAVGEGVVVRHTEEVQHRVARLMAELLPDCVPMGFNGPWGPWKAALSVHTVVRLRPATANWPHQAEPCPSGEEAHVYEALLEKNDLAFEQLSLVDALNGLADAHQVQLFIDLKALAEVGVGTDTPLTCSVKRLNFKTALALLLDELNLTYLVRDEVLVITTKTAAENLLTTKVYPVFDLVVRPPDAPATRPDLDFPSLINNITTNIAPETWDETGGPGTIQPFTNSAALAISQTTRVHEEIVEYLRSLREAGAAQKQQRADVNR